MPHILVLVPQSKEACMFRVRLLLASAFLVSLAFVAGIHAQATAQAPGHNIVSPATIQWSPAPPSMPPGAMMAVLAGDPGKDGLFIVRAKLPDGYKVAPHWHPTDEHVTVLKGSVGFGMGEKFDAATLKPVGAGGMFTAQAKMPHYIQAKGETIIQVTAMGPFVLNYVNPADAPAAAKPKTN